MENNIFFKNKKDKFNPDVITNLSKKSTERKNTTFKQTGQIYNPITNVVPKEIRSQKDLIINTNEPFDDVKKLINIKRSERSKQDFDLKPQKIKALPDNLIIEKPIENFEELKNNSVNHQQQMINNSNQGKIKKNDIILNLVKLGIIKR